MKSLNCSIHKTVVACTLVYRVYCYFNFNKLLGIEFNEIIDDLMKNDYVILLDLLNVF